METIKKIYQKIAPTEEDSFFKTIVSVYVISIFVFGAVFLIFRSRKTTIPQKKTHITTQYIRPKIIPRNHVAIKRNIPPRRQVENKYPTKFKISSVLT